MSWRAFTPDPIFDTKSKRAAKTSSGSMNEGRTLPCSIVTVLA